MNSGEKMNFTTLVQAVSYPLMADFAINHYGDTRTQLASLAQAILDARVAGFELSNDLLNCFPGYADLGFTAGQAAQEGRNPDGGHG